LPATKVYRAERGIKSAYGLALHTVTVCDLGGNDFKCEATAVIGPAGRVFYVSENAVYVWTTDWEYTETGSSRSSMVYRMPLDGSAPGALGVSGSPVDQFSFLESDDSYLNVLVRSDSQGDGMWSSESSAGDVALMRVPLEKFSDGNDDVSQGNYRRLPAPRGYGMQNRFVGDFLLYGSGSGYWSSNDESQDRRLFAVRWKDGETNQLSLKHGVDRIEALGSDAVVVGTRGKDLYFTSIDLSGQPDVADEYRRKDASQGETRSHGFFYKANGPRDGILGLPIMEAGKPGYANLREGSASVLYLRNNGLRLDELGYLSASRNASNDDSCKASCVDWYGNARPIFLRGRMFALLGYELVEGRLDDGGIREVRRTSFAPGRAIALRN
jgi:hypothetical protein